MNVCSALCSQNVSTTTKATLQQIEALKLQHKPNEAIKILSENTAVTKLPIDLAYLYAHQSIIHASFDSLLLAKKLADESMKNAIASKNKAAIAVAYRASANLNNIMNLPDVVVKDALAGLKSVEDDDTDLNTKFYLYYLLYSAHSNWDDGDKMEEYIRQAQYYATKAGNYNLLADANNGISSMYQARYKKTQEKNLLDSSLYYLKASFALIEKHPEKVSGNVRVITCINLANYYLEYATAPLQSREQQAFYYLNIAEGQLKKINATSTKWMNIYGIKSGFAKQKNDMPLARQYLLQGLGILMQDDGKNYKLEYIVHKELADMALKQDDAAAALTYQQKAETLLKKSFNEQQLFNAQKLEVQYETQKKDRELELLKERNGFRKKQNYLYGGIALALLFGLVFMFISYHFRLRYSIEREKKLAKEKEDAEQQAQWQLKLEKEEQARLKAEQELLDLRKQQLEKEALANSLIIERKNDTLKQIQQKIKTGEANHIQKLIKEEMLMQTDFEEIKTEIQQLHPDFFDNLSRKAVQKLTPLDLKYCTYLYLKMNTKQIAQALHVEPQSVRMFKYRLKQKFGLTKDDDLELLLKHNHSGN